jgi:hypothetical protein
MRQVVGGHDRWPADRGGVVAIDVDAIGWPMGNASDPSRISRERPTMSSLTLCQKFSNRLRRQGWTVEESTFGVEGPINPIWVVWGHNGEDRIRTHGGTRDEAWRLACELAEAARRRGQGE